MGDDRHRYRCHTSFVIFPIAVDEAGPMNEVEQGFLSI